MLTVILILLFVLSAAAIMALGLAMVTPASVVGMRLDSLLSRTPSKAEHLRLSERLQHLMEPLSKIVPQSPGDVSETRHLLMQAGYRETRHLATYLGIRVLTIAGAVIFVLSTGMLGRRTMMALAIVALSWILPGFLLKRSITRRQLRLKLSLPDALDLAVICVEAGLALDQAITRITAELSTVHPELSDEFALVNLEMRAGKPRTEALRNLANRTGVDDIRALTAVLIQTDRFGTSVASALRVHSDALRTERRQRAEEQAAKTTIKMIPVLVFFVFPAMFVVTLGPGVIQIMRNLLPAVQR